MSSTSIEGVFHVDSATGLVKVDGNLSVNGSVAALAYAASVPVDFDPDISVYRTLTLTGNVAFTSANLGPSRQASILLTDDGSARTLAFPAGWVFLGVKPTAMTASKKGILSLVSYGAADASVVAAYSEEA